MRPERPETGGLEEQNMGLARPPRTVRAIPLLIVVCFVIFPVQAQYSGGSGTAEDPYQIATAAGLIALGETPEDSDKRFILTADIDLNPKLPGRKIFQKAVIASFKGTFAGNGHTISHLTIAGTNYLGLFGRLVSRGIVKDLGIANADITGSGLNVGALVGRNEEGGVIHCYSTGMVSGDDYVGGLVGYNYVGTVANSYSAAAVSGNDYVGGLVGLNAENVINCYGIGTVIGNKRVGGLIGDNHGGAVLNNYSMGMVSGADYVGGLVGYNNRGTISDSYSTSAVECSNNDGSVGGLIGHGGNHATGCFWDIETSGQVVSAGGSGLITSEMQDVQTYQGAGWDFAGDPADGTSETWLMTGVDSYPVLAIWNGHPPLSLRGTGTRENPYVISNALELGATCYHSPYAHYHLDNSIDLSGIHWGMAVIACFAGTFDGNGHTISHLTVAGGGALGLFGYLGAGAEVRDLGMVDVNMIASDRYVGALGGFCGGDVTDCYSTGTVTGTESVGGLLGANKGTLENCHVSGSIWGHNQVGGLVGVSDGAIAKCYSTGSVSGGNGCHNLGGLVGENGHGRISNSCAAGTVTCGDDSYNVGGLVGHNLYASISHCWSAGDISGGRRCQIFGGLVGRAYGGSISNCYSSAHVWLDRESRFSGGLVGQNNGGPVSHCFWDIEASGLSTSEGGFGRTTYEMKTGTTYVGWGGGTWTIVEGLDYPHLAWESRGGVAIENVPVRTYAGYGTELAPFVLADGTDFYCLMARAEDWGSYFQLVNDIDMGTVKGYLPIGSFSGVLDGRRYRILNLNIAESSGPLGLMGCLQGGHVWDVGLVDISVAGAGGNIGSLAGINGSGGSILRCYSTGSVSGADETRLIGGLVGANNGSISQCYSTARVSGGDQSPIVGGLVGSNGDGSITNCRSTGRVSSGENCFQVGGLVGMNLWGTITNCYSVGGVAGGMNSWDIGGFAGSNVSIILRCFWDTEASGVSQSRGGTGRPTPRMQTAATFRDAGWDFVGETANGTEDIWWILEGQDYPRLWWELPEEVG